MTNKEMIKKLRDNAELAWAAYGYYDLIGKKFSNKSNTRKREFITLQDIMDITYQGYDAVEIIQLGQEPKEITLREIGGDMSPTQAQNFFKRYELLEYYPHFDEKNNKQIDGFHACLFKNRETQEFTLAIRGSYDIEDYGTDG